MRAERRGQRGEGGGEERAEASREVLASDPARAVHEHLLARQRLLRRCLFQPTGEVCGPSHPWINVLGAALLDLPVKSTDVRFVVVADVDHNSVRGMGELVVEVLGLQMHAAAAQRRFVLAHAVEDEFIAR